MQEQYVTVQKYASMHRMSIHTVIKKTMNGELKSFEKEVDGKKVTYVYSNPAKAPIEHAEDKSEDLDDEIDYKSAYEALNKEYLVLKTKYEKLLQSLQQ